jgi:hypothetical protein
MVVTKGWASRGVGISGIEELVKEIEYTTWWLEFKTMYCILDYLLENAKHCHHKNKNMR